MDEEARGRWLCAIGKHVIRFQQDDQATYVYAILRTSQEADLLMRLRRQGRVTAQQVKTFARACGIPVQELSDILRAQADAGLLGLDFDARGQLVSLTEEIFTEAAVFKYAAMRFEQRQPEQSERAIVPLMDLLSRLPLDIDQVTDLLVREGFSEPDVREAVDLAASFGLAQKRVVPDFESELLYNEYLWAHKIDRVQAVLAGLRDRETNDLLALMEEIGQAQGTPAEALTAAPKHLVDMATRVGLVDGIKIKTMSGREKVFTFSPQFDGLGAGRATTELAGISDQVKLLVASIQYGVRYSEDFRLDAPLAFMNKLVNTGEAGDATPIGRDYILVEKYGILRTVPTTGSRARFEVVKHDIVTAARDALAQGRLGSGPETSPRTLVDQRDFLSPEAMRLRLADAAGASEVLEKKHLAAIRESVQNGSWL
ncbi:hypothetical protein ACIBSS_22625 [Micromonospora aurantiaca]|uniref:hypothetical protein n=1 Tax=Micromonospora aurantiaca (nom. illeg.) TaxID=47850 RepID=UPI0011CE45E6|nr:hypothetical protein [Micromonospora aurantiaca]